jgi:hypothetical protein
VNQIDPDAHGDDWLFEIVLDQSSGTSVGRAETASCHADELELVEVSGLEHEPEIELVLKTSSVDPAIVAADVLQVAAEVFGIRAAEYTLTDEGVRFAAEPVRPPSPSAT